MYPCISKTHWRLFLWLLLDVCIFWSGVTTESAICCTFVFCTVKQEWDYCFIKYLMFNCGNKKTMFSLACFVFLWQILFFHSLFSSLLVFGSVNLFSIAGIKHSYYFLTIISASSSKHTQLHTPMQTARHRRYKMCEINGKADKWNVVGERLLFTVTSRFCMQRHRLAGKGWDEEAHRNTITFPCSGRDKNGAYYQFLFDRKCSGDVFSLEGKWRPDSERSWWPIVSPVISKTNTAAEEQTHDWKQHG